MATETILHFVGGSSDKIYKVTIANLVGERRFDVNVEYGRRGSTMKHLNKGMSMLEDTAKEIHDRLVKDKLAKGYQLVSSNAFDINLAKARPLSSKFLATEIEVQLLNAISLDEAEKYIKDPAWGMQEKMDGERRPVALLKTCNSKEVVGFNRKGQEVILPDKISTALGSSFEPIEKTIFDAEIIGDQLFVFDILQFNGVSVANSSFLDRWKMVDTELGLPDMSIIAGFNPFINVVQLAITENEKRFMFYRVLAEGGEGVVFKKLDAPYTQGRPNSGGPALKCKFVESASFCVGEANEGKRSVPLYLLELIADDGVIKQHWLHHDVGNVTIPVNHKIPPQGSVIEVQYLYAFEGGSVYQPVFKGVRNDLVDIDCLLSQLKFKKVADFNSIEKAKPDPLKSSFAW